MKCFVIALVVLIAACARAELPSGWSTNLTSALAEAGERGEPVLVYFTAAWCGPCKAMARTTFTNEAVLQALAGLRTVAVDIDNLPAVAGQYGVRAVPTFAMVSPAGNEVARVTGYQSAPELVSWVTNSVALAREAQARKQRFREQIAAVDALLASGGAAADSRVAAGLFEICGERDAGSVKAAVERLQTLAARDAAVLLEGLNHPRLATRIQVANILRARLGEQFDIDVWADEPMRKAAVEQWRARLTR